MRFRWTISFVLLFPLCLPMQLLASAQEPATEGGFVYVMTNRAEGNSVLVYRRASTGGLSLVQEAPTMGLGTGFSNDPFASQGSLSLSNDHKLLLAVNAGSGDITAFAVTASGLQFGSKAPSHGVFPVSVTAFGGVVYVLNQLGTANIAGFSADPSGHLQFIADSKRPLAGGALAQPAQVSFTPDGKELLVTEKGTDLIDVFDVQGNGTATGPMAQKATGHTPFGFMFGPSGSVVVTDAERRLAKKATASSYTASGGSVNAQSSAVPNGQTAACWATVTENTAWVVNTGTSTISAYGIDSGGGLTLLNPVAASTGVGTAPIDLAATPDGNFVYVLKSATGGIAGYAVNSTSLTPLFDKAGLPLSIQGIAVQ